MGSSVSIPNPKESSVFQNSKKIHDEETKFPDEAPLHGNEAACKKSSTTLNKASFLIPTITTILLLKRRNSRIVKNENGGGKSEHIPAPDGSPQTPLQCTICNMAFSSPMRYENHVRYSSIHAKMLKEGVKAEIECLRNPTVSDPKVVSKRFVQWKMIFEGSKFFWQKQKRFDVIIWTNDTENLILVYMNDPNLDKKIDKIFLKLDKIKQIVDEDRIKQTVHAEIIGLHYTIRQNVDEEKRAEEAVTNAMVSYIIAKLNIAPAQGDEYRVVFNRSAAVGVICEEPSDVQVPSIQQATNKTLDLDNNQKMFESAANEVNEYATSAAEFERLIQEALEFGWETSTALQERGNLYHHEINMEIIRMRSVHTENQITSMQKRLQLARKRLLTAVNKTPQKIEQDNKEALQLLEKLTKNDVAVCKSFKKPNPLLTEVFSLLLLMMGETDTSWNAAQVVMSGTNKCSFLTMVKEVSLDSLPFRKFLAVQDYVNANPACLDRELLQGISPLAEALGAILLVKYEMKLGIRVEVEGLIGKLEGEIAAMEKERAAIKYALKQASSFGMRKHSVTGIPQSQLQQCKLKPSLKNTVKGIMFMLHGMKVIDTSSSFSRRKSIP